MNVPGAADGHQNELAALSHRQTALRSPSLCVLLA
jgi:hypothetical protein